jgi:hypothetical protein
LPSLWLQLSRYLIPQLPHIPFYYFIDWYCVNYHHRQIYYQGFLKRYYAIPRFVPSFLSFSRTPYASEDRYKHENCKIMYRMRRFIFCYMFLWFFLDIFSAIYMEYIKGFVPIRYRGYCLCISPHLILSICKREYSNTVSYASIQFIQLIPPVASSSAAITNSFTHFCSSAVIVMARSILWFRGGGIRPIFFFPCLEGIHW